MNSCWPNRMAFKLLTWQDGLQVEFAWWLSSYWMVVELMDGCRARVMAVACDGWMLSLCDGVEHVQWHLSSCQGWWARMMVGELVRWMLSSCDGVELADFVQSLCRVHVKVVKLTRCCQAPGWQLSAIVVNLAWRCWSWTMTGKLVWWWLSSSRDGVELTQCVFSCGELAHSRSGFWCTIALARWQGLYCMVQRVARSEWWVW